MGDPRVGLYEKFRVYRADGMHCRGEKHDGCRYFVLDLTHDPFAIGAVLHYADLCRAKYPMLAADLDKTEAADAPEPEV